MESPGSLTLKGPGDEDDDQIVSTLGEIGEQTHMACIVELKEAKGILQSSQVPGNGKSFS